MAKNSLSAKQSPAAWLRYVWLVLAIVSLCVLSLVLFWWGRTEAGAGHTAHEMSVDGGTTEPTTTLRPFAAAVSGKEDRNSVVYRCPNNNMEIALTFDDGPHPRYTPMILEILEEYGIKATFFMIGENVRYYTPAAEAVVRAGHEVGNHTESHHSLRPLGESAMRREIQACEEAIFSVAEYRPCLIRPPEGEMNDTMKKLMSDMGYRIILWDVDTRDWAHTPPATIAARVLEDVQAGDIILMHDFIGERSPTPEALRLLIPALLERGYRFVTVGELLGHT